MRLIILLILNIIPYTGCATYNQLEQIKVIYRAESHGLYLSVKIENNKFYVSNVRNESYHEVNLKDSEWKSLAHLYNEIDLTTFEKLKGATDYREYDKKALGNLYIIKNEKEYKTLGFDHTIPPREIKSFVDMIVTFAKR